MREIAQLLAAVFPVMSHHDINGFALALGQCVCIRPDRGDMEKTLMPFV